jgi:hypothetical protein
MMGGRGGAPRTNLAGNIAAAAARAEVSNMESRILDAYRHEATRTNGWVKLSDLRDALGAAERSDVNRALVDLANNRRIVLIPEENQKTLTPVSRAAALRYGGEDQHLIRIEG